MGVSQWGVHSFRRVDASSKRMSHGEPYGFPAKAICRSSMAYETIPNYVSDLNAMQEAEDNLTGEERQRYIEQLVWRQNIWIDENKACAFAIAPQRAECFLRVKGKWVQG